MASGPDAQQAHRTFLQIGSPRVQNCRTSTSRLRSVAWNQVAVFCLGVLDGECHRSG